QSGFVKREKKNLVPTDDGNVLITVLPDEIKSPKMTAEWEMALNHIAQNTETADEFLNGITELMQELVARYQGISEEKKNQFQGKAKGEVIGKCPRCGADVRE
ncbi:DNA topoisomerase III, partial [Eubacterium callanderi]